MNRFRNITVHIFLSVIILTMGSFSSALMHLDCNVDSHVHITCEMECCRTDKCCETAGNIENISDGKELCCEVHLETAVNQDSPLLVINKYADRQKLLSVKTNNESVSFSPVIFNINTGSYRSANIFIEVSNLRI